MLSIVSKPPLASLHILAIISKWSCEEHTDSIHLPNTERRTSEVEKSEEETNLKGEARRGEKIFDLFLNKTFLILRLMS